MANGSHPDRRYYVWQGASLLAQAGPVQNQWYPVLLTTLAEVQNLIVEIADTGEDLEWRATIDGVVSNVSDVSAAADTPYYGVYNSNSVGWRTGFATTDPSTDRSYLLRGKTVLIEVRKTTAVGVGSLFANAPYARYL